jgi:type IX secretion system PorP/SprF family membrane protein
MKKIVAAILIACACAGTVHGQDVHFSEFNETPLHINPAYTGLFDGIFRVSLHYRNQWTSMGSPYKTTAGSFDCAIGNPNRARLGIGAFFYKDQAGDSKLGTFNGSLSLSGLVKIDDVNTLSAGFMFGYAQRSADITTLQWENQYINGAYDPNASTGEGNLLTSFPYVDFAGGVAYQFRSVSGSLVGKDVFELNVGLSAFHLNTPDQKFHGGGNEEKAMRIVGHTHARIDMPGTAWSIRPSVTYIRQGPGMELMFGGAFRYRIRNGTKVTNFFSESGIGMGVHYRWKDAIVPQLYYDLGDFFIGLAYDVNISRYSAISKYQGGYEITIRYANLNGALYKNKRK